MSHQHLIIEQSVPYGPGDGCPLLLDIYRAQTQQTRQPAIVLIHGGGMWTGRRTDMEPTARQLAHAGYVSVSIDYRLVEAATGRHRWPTQLDDVQLAVRWVRANAQAIGIDPRQVGAYGWSAGGQLAALLGMRDTRDVTAPLAQTSSRVQAAVVLAGDVDLAAYTHPPELHEVTALLGGTVHEVPDQYRDASPLSWIDTQTAPFLIIHSVHDDVVPIAQSRSLVTALRQATVPVQFVELPDGGHDQMTWPRIGPAVLAFLAQHLQQTASQDQR